MSSLKFTLLNLGYVYLKFPIYTERLNGDSTMGKLYVTQLKHTELMKCHQNFIIYWLSPKMLQIQIITGIARRKNNDLPISPTYVLNNLNFHM